jgi:hypothetical protein
VYSIAPDFVFEDFQGRLGYISFSALPPPPLPPPRHPQTQHPLHTALYDYLIRLEICMFFHTRYTQT